MPTRIFIWVTPEEKILGNNFLKKNFTLLFTLKLNLSFYPPIFIPALFTSQHYFESRFYKNSNFYFNENFQFPNYYYLTSLWMNIFISSLNLSYENDFSECRELDVY